MWRSARAGRWVGVVLALSLLPAATPAAVAAGTWSGSVDLYRAGVFTTQPDYITCVPTSVQIMLNVIRGQHDHRISQIRSLYQEGRGLNAHRYPIPGLDPQAWAALLERHGGGAYADRMYRTFAAALTAAAVAIRRTGRPVGLLVDHGRHAWVMTGFRATADPAVDRSARITAVRVSGPLYPMQQRGGYDLPPDTQLSSSRFAAFLTRYQEIFPVRWTGSYVIVEPIVARATVTAAAAGSTPSPSRPPDPPWPVWPVVPALARALPN